MFIIDDSDDEYLEHYGTPRKSGRYPWGSGSTQGAKNRTFLQAIDEFKKSGMSEVDIARAGGLSVTELRALKSIARNEQRASNAAYAQRLKEKGMSNIAIGERMGLNESSVRSLLKAGEGYSVDVHTATASMLKGQVDAKRFVDIGSGNEQQLGISKERLNVAVQMLKEQGYVTHNVQIDQVGAQAGNKTLVKVLAPAGTTYRDIVTNMDQIHTIKEWSDDGGKTFTGFQPPIQISPKRVAVKYAEDGGDLADGVMYVRPGVSDLSLGGANYAQVRVAVGGTHYLKGMAFYKSDLPPGVDIQFNTNKSKGTPMLGNKDNSVLKPLKDDADLPFGAVVRQLKDPATGKPTSAMNIVNEEGDWDKWSRNMASQTLSKQSPSLAKTQLDMTYEKRRQEYEDIMSLTNPAVRKKLLEAYADSVDAAGVHLQAAALRRSSWHVLLPFNSLKSNEIYAPNYRDGERVALIRYPHGGKFEIPELTVNNRNVAARKALGSQPKDAVGINATVAKRLSGADFDGDAVLVIPNGKRSIKSEPALQGLKDFDPQKAYPGFPGMKVMDAQTKAFEMGDVSNLITDMTIRGASASELARAVRHSMVVIDAEKHGLNWRESAKANGIAALKKDYQGRSNAGASTLISRATSRQDVNARKRWNAGKAGSIDPVTGRKVFQETGENWQDAKGNTVFRKQRSTKLAETDNAHTLSSGTAIEKVYGDHSNKLKALANEARLSYLNTPPTAWSRSAEKVYSKEVKELNSALHLALENRPRERQAQIVANTTIRNKKAAKPDMSKEELKKVQAQALNEARLATGAKKQQIKITDEQWAAIQAGAISNHRLKEILDNADLDRVKELATPRTSVLMTATKQRRAEAMAASGYTQAEIADALGVSLTTLKRGLQ